MTLAQRVQQLWEALDAADEVEDEETRRAGLCEVIRVIEAATGEGESPDLFFMLGYALYLHPERRSDVAIQHRLDTALQRVLALEPGHDLAKLYLGHNEYDLQRYDTAANWFRAVDRSRVEPLLSLKALEMVLCCSLRCSGLAASLGLLRDFADACATHPMTDVHPLNLYAAIRDGLPAAADAVEEARPALARIDASGEFRWFADLLSSTR